MTDLEKHVNRPGRDKLVKKVKDQGQPLYLTIINNNNQRRYLGVKLK